MTYRLSLNAAEFKNFQSEAGVPLEPVAYTFKTSGKKTETAEAGKKWDEQQQVKMAEAGNQWAAYGLWDSYYRGKNGIKPDPAKADKWLREFLQNVWVVRFEPVDDFKPATASEFLARLHQYAHTGSGKTNLGLRRLFTIT